MVRLKERTKLATRRNKRNFNSKVVRLKVANRMKNKEKLPIFQFQSGAVKRYRVCRMSTLIRIFQFQSGAVKRSRATGDSKGVVDFNSKVVRLKVIEISEVMFTFI